MVILLLAVMLTGLGASIWSHGSSTILTTPVMTLKSTGMPTHLAINSKVSPLAADGLIEPYAWHRSVRMSIRSGL